MERRRLVGRKNQTGENGKDAFTVGESAFCAGSPVRVYYLSGSNTFYHDRDAGACV